VKERCWIRKKEIEIGERERRRKRGIDNKWSEYKKRQK